MSPTKIVFDVEGVILNPKFDLAWLTLDELVEPELRDKFYERVKEFDEYDDNRWVYERGRKGHSTGTTPIVSLCIAACSGVSDIHLLRFALKHMKENPGIEKVMGNLGKDDVYLVTSSWPGVPLTLSYFYEIPLQNVFSMGHQLNEEEIKKYSWNPRKQLFLRSPLPILRNYPRELENFLDEYLESCGEWNEAYKEGETEKLDRILREQRKIFNEVRPRKLREELKYLLLKEKGIMGAHRKREVLEKLGEPEEIIYFGDSIVDADPLAYARWGVSVNCTNRYALQSSNLNIATTNLEKLGKVIEGIKNKDLQSIREEEGMKVFFREEINSNLEAVIRENRKCKEELKAQF